MKVDIVVNSMIQQIDRNLKTQVMPALTYRAGEMLQGKVMLTAGDRLQIRLDNGALLNAIPAGDVLLSPGATVTLRVTGQMDGNLIMQLLDQEPDGRLAATLPGQAVDRALAKMGFSATPQNRSVVQAMDRMKIPLREETVRQALEILGTYPDLSADKAVFIAANRIKATPENIDALNRLVDGRATTGGELKKLADILSAQALEAETVWLAGDTDSQAAPSPIKHASALPPAGLDAPATQPTGQGGTSPASAQAPAAQGAPASPTEPQQAAAQFIAGEGKPSADPAAGLPMAAPEAESILPGALPVPVQAAAPGGDEGLVQLESLIFVALGMEAAEQSSGIVVSLQQSGMLKQAVALALDGPYASDELVAEKLQAFADALPRDTGPEAAQFMGKLISGLKKYMSANGPEAMVPAKPGDAPTGLPVLKEIGELFVRLENGSDGTSLGKAAGAQQARLTHIAAEIGSSGAASPDAVQQLNRVTSHVRLIDDISQYAYQQIPVQLDGKQRTVELYVMNKGRGGRKVKADSANILIALDTDNLGHIETLINVSQKNLRLRFGLERPSLVGVVDSYMNELSKALQAIGFRLSDVRMQVITKPVTPLTVAETVDSGTGSSGKLDMRL